MAAGVTINCNLLKREARFIVFGKANDERETPADNDQWLEMFKQGHGIDSKQGNPLESLLDDFPLHSLSAESLPDNLLDYEHDSLSATIQDTKCNASTSSSEASVLPWQWTTPECLAELYQMAGELSISR